MPRLPGQGKTAAVAAGAGVTHPSGGQDDVPAPVLLSPRGADPHGAPLLQENLRHFGLKNLGPAIFREAHQGIGDAPGTVGNRVDPVPPLGLQGHPQLLEKSHGAGGGIAPDGAVKKLWVGADVFQKILRGAVVGKVAPALAGNQNLPGGALPALRHQDGKPPAGGIPGTEEPCGSATDDDGIPAALAFPAH